MAAWTTAADMAVINELASLGAPARLVATLTGVSLNTVRTVLRGTELSPSEPLVAWSRWISADPERALEAHALLKAYRRTPEGATKASRMIEAYTTIREIAPETRLTISNAYIVIESVNDGTAIERRCTSCDKSHLTCDDQPVCPACQQIESMFCRKCGLVLPQRKATTGRIRTICDTCKPPRRKTGTATLTTSDATQTTSGTTQVEPITLRTAN